jgi:hypothetical protein
MFWLSSHKYDLLNLPPILPTEIQYWAGVIMCNACLMVTTEIMDAMIHATTTVMAF